MAMSNEPISPFTIERVCKPSPKIADLVLKEVDTSESVYVRILNKLYDATLPKGYLIVPGGPDDYVVQPTVFDLFIMEKYRQDWKPNGYGLGEMTFSMSLLPNEEITLELKTWETDKRMSEQEKQLEDRQLTDIKSVASQASETRTEQNSKTHEYLDAKATYGGFGFNVSCAGGWAKDVEDKRMDFGKQTLEGTQQATNERKAIDKVKIAVSRESGSESKTTRKIRNINQAHTLNVNYYQVLREYQVALVLYDVSLVLLGAEVDLATTDLGSYHRQYELPDEPGATQSLAGPSILKWLTQHNGQSKYVTLGQLITMSQSGDWIQSFTQKHGISPIKLLREMWSEPLYNAALSLSDWAAGQYITPEERAEFRDTVLRFARPSPGWIEVDEKGAFRWGYEVLQEQASPLLSYLYQFLPNSAQQLLARATASGRDPISANEAIANCYLQSSVPYYSRRAFKIARPVLPHGAQAISAEEKNFLITKAAYHLAEQRGFTGGDSVSDWLAAEAEINRRFQPLQLAKADKILPHGLFKDMELRALGTELSPFKKAVDAHLNNFVEQLRKLRLPEGETGPKEVLVRSWTTTLPTHGLYADLSLGVCSGAEDYFEIQRQFDLESKKLEIEKLGLQLERLRLENQLMGKEKSGGSVVIKNPTEQTAINLGINVTSTTAEVDIIKEDSPK
jgi:hypothetical protein